MIGMVYVLHNHTVGHDDFKFTTDCCLNKEFWYSFIDFLIVPINFPKI